mmetsp:Transcript_54320/g.118158  ORF Transcript_54320/g.118158 Transcript_54320/m.118158 type:complete len:113 (+) Transcript_54320:1-339(+)
MEESSPSLTHMFCGWLRRQGWLRRVYTQNIDGLHTHPSVDLERDYVVECHGSLRDGTCVLYGDPIRAETDIAAVRDFDLVGPFPGVVHQNVTLDRAGPTPLIWFWSWELRCR